MRRVGDPDAPAIAIEGLVKVYPAANRLPAKRALNGVDLLVPRGSVFGLLGPNGAGKSTLINILAGLVTKTEGRVRVSGIDVDKNPRRARLAIGVVPQELNMDPFFAPRETLDIQAGLYGVPRAKRRTDEILRAVGLADKANVNARALSGGMRRRLLIAKALVHDPDVVILDEPTAGVDVELRRALWAYMRELNTRGVTVVLTTHYLEEAEQMCDRIAIIDRGDVVASDRTSTLLSRLDQKCLTLTLTKPVAELPANLAALGAERVAADRIEVRYHPSRTRAGAILDAVRAAGLDILDLNTAEPDLEDLFVRLTSHPAEAA